MASLPIDATKKTSLLNLIKAKDCNAAHYINQKLVNWDDGPKLLVEFSKTFDCDPAYLDDILSIFTDSELTDVGIYYNKTGITINNPVFVVKSTNVNVAINSGGRVEEVDIVHGSQVNSVVISNDTTIVVFSISGNSVVASLDAQPSNRVEVLIVKTCGSNTAELTTITQGSQVDNVSADEPAVFGGYTCDISGT